ncbi:MULTISPECIES: ribosome silencing factor [Vibrio]|uniref:Ribosomal silencing factor RsfS n=1 Tax=Vibrio chanodichtyis TaxID=3027932 RepID=A0ABT5UXB8_9VIBR|nr:MULTISPECIES: ribosome silencing factor [Vibrio]MDE1513422.1 ribosome silencing factor [Vibrio chanodichtyis]QIL86112.1 ribosome silencing factor [Vibrio sp. HDW18]
MQAEALKDFLADKADDIKAVDITTLDVQGKSSVTDFMIVCTGTSKTHVTSIAEHVANQAKLAGLTPLGINGENEGQWVVLDMGSVMLHVMQASQRELYQLEKLWG